MLEKLDISIIRGSDRVKILGLRAGKKCYMSIRLIYQF